MHDDTQQGGPEWERNQAAKKIAAGLSVGDEAAIAQGASDLGDAVVNSVISKAFKSLERTLEIVLNNHLGPISKHQVDLGSNFVELKGEMLTRLDASNNAQENIHKAVQEVGLGLGKLAEEQAAQGERLDRVEASVSGLSEQQGTTEAKVDQATVRVDALEETVQAVVVTLNEHTETLAQHTELLNKINDQYTNISVIMMHLELFETDSPPPPEVAAVIDRLRDANQ